MFTVDQVYHGFRLRRQEQVAEANSAALVFVHEKTQAELVVLCADDDNKMFCITFRTPPPDDTGVPHILEHAVLNGSKKYPLKEPFLELLKASLYTFLNAMTATDHTVYPVASRNQQDFRNLMDVYLDAVFNPKLSRETFMQEGWHYQLDKAEAELQFSGVVYNEMLGATSSPESVLGDELDKALTPDNVYGRNSGGEPERIPELSYEQFRDFHRRYYHPSNSRIVLYGDFDVAAKLAHLEEFLGNYDFLEVDSAIAPHPRFAGPVRKQATYPITPGDDPANKTYVVRAWLLDQPTDPEFHLAFSILARILAGTAAAPLRKALIDSHLGEDCLAWFAGDMLDTQYCIGLKGTEAAKETEIEELIDSTLAKLATDGLARKTVAASVNSVEFWLREANFGGFSKGLFYAMRMNSAWLYGADPLGPLQYEAPLAAIKKKVARAGYFEGLIRKYLIDNPHQVNLTMTPDDKQEGKRLERLHRRLTEIKGGLDEGELGKLVAQCEALREAQRRPDSPEALATIPKLPLDCVPREAEFFPLEIISDSPEFSFSEQATNGIGYVKLVFDCSMVPQELLAYLPLFGQISLQAGTRKRDFVDLSEEFGIHTGGVSSGFSATPIWEEPEKIISMLTYNGKALKDKLPKMLELLAEVFAECDLDNLKRIAEIAGISRAGMESSINHNGAHFAMSRLAAYQTSVGMYGELTGGLEQYYFLERVVNELAEKPAGVIANLKRLSELLFTRDNLRIHLTGSTARSRPRARQGRGLRRCRRARSSVRPRRRAALPDRSGWLLPGSMRSPSVPGPPSRHPPKRRNHR